MKTSFKQRKFGVVLAGGTALLLASGLASAALSGSKHDFAQGINTSKFQPTVGSAEICVFCHTPHGGSTTAPAPLWNRNLFTTGTYTRYSSLGTPSFDSTEAPVGSISLACLSCHDGTQAMNSFINAPGSGNPASTGTWTGTNVDATGKMIVGTAGQNYPMLGTDLSNDHPISMQYGGGGVVVGSSGPTTTDPDFGQPTNNNTTTTIGSVGYFTKNANDIWYVEANGVAGMTKTDIPLYTRTDLTTVQPFVECGSCHDPHNTTNNTFLRTTNAGSALCLTCHAK